MGVKLNVLDTYNATVGGMIAVLSYLFGEHWALFGIFLLFNIADWFTGWLKSYLAHKENSVAGLKGIVKKLSYWIMIYVSFLASYWFIGIGKAIGTDLHITTLLGWFVLASLTVNELRSILENFVEAGFDVPQVLVKGLEVADKAFNKQDGEPPIDEKGE